MSDTPRTDANEWASGFDPESSGAVWSNFARELERENNLLRAQLADAHDALSLLQGWCYDLRGEWQWKKNEPRAGNQADYDALIKGINTSHRILGTNSSATP